MARLDIATEDGKEGIITPESKVPKLIKPINSNSVQNMSFLLVALFVMVGILIFGINQTQKVRIKSFNNSITIKDQELSKLSDIDKQAKEIYGQVNNLESLWSQKNTWSNVMKELSSTTTKRVKLNSVSVEESGIIDLNGKTDSFTSLAKFLASIEQNDNFGPPSLNSTAFEAEAISFGIVIPFSSGLLGTSNPPNQE